MAPARAPGIVGGDQQAGLAVGADHLGQGAAGGGHQRHPAGHGLDGRQREALVERRHHRHLGLGVVAGQFVVADPDDATARIGTRSSRSMALATRPSGRGACR